jgi:AcrR family transcriptional regulator
VTTPKVRDTRNKGVTRAMVAAAAAEVLDEGGMAKLSMRQVAVRLGVSPMALYNHVQSKDELLELLADHLRAQVAVDPALAPRDQLLSLLTQLRDLGARHPALLEGASSLNSSSHAAELAVLELRLLRELGLTPAQVRVAYQGLVLLVNGAAVVWRARALDPGEGSRLRDQIRAAGGEDDVEHLESLEALPRQTAEEAFALAVDQVLRAAAALPPEAG